MAAVVDTSTFAYLENNCCFGIDILLHVLVKLLRYILFMRVNDLLH